MSPVPEETSGSIEHNLSRVMEIWPGETCGIKRPENQSLVRKLYSCHGGADKEEVWGQGGLCFSLPGSTWFCYLEEVGGSMDLMLLINAPNLSGDSALLKTLREREELRGKYSGGQWNIRAPPESPPLPLTAQLSRFLSSVFSSGCLEESLYWSVWFTLPPSCEMILCVLTSGRSLTV